MTPQTNSVGDFFNRIADGYRSKYGKSDAFLHYFFHERLIEACRGHEFRGKRILDVGAGTGNLYDFLLNLEPDIDYYATDIAENMLRQSRIPVNRQFVGELDNVKLPPGEFDRIFVLGVTTYLDDTQMNGMLDRLYNICAPNGKIIITFTNAESLDWKSRALFRRLPRRFLPKRFVLTQGFQIYPHSASEIRRLIEGRFAIDDLRWLNHTIFPVNQILKRPSVAMAKKIHDTELARRWMNRLSSDFMFVLSKNS
jgi:ubiquinone/menaquinone biosynthesis C-methylase UbiE